MAEVLSQTEIDALLSAVSSGTVPTEEPPEKSSRRTDWLAYDLTSQEKLVKSRLGALQGIHERFARLFRASLSAALKKTVVVHCTNTEFMRFGDYSQHVMLPTSLNIIDMKNLGGSMIFTVTSKLAYALVDAYYGGSERPFHKMGGRDQFTTIEANMIKKLCAFAVRDLQEAWQPNYAIELEHVKTESNPQFVGAINTSDLVAVVNFEVELESLSGPLMLLVQLRALDPIQASLGTNVTGESAAESEAWRRHWLHELKQLPLDLRVELGTTRRTLRQIQEWRPGQTLLLGQDAQGPLTVYLDDVPKLTGIMGSCRGSTAVSLTEDPTPQS